MTTAAFAIDWSTAPDWISSVGAVGAIAVALWVSLRETKLRRLHDEDEEKGQARLVIVGAPGIGRAEYRSGPESLFVTVINYCETPIHELWLGMSVGRGHGEAPEPHFIGTDFLGPGEKTKFEFEIPCGKGSPSTGPPELWFLDSYGRRWKRTGGIPEPERILEYIDPSLPTEIRDLIAQNRADERRGWLGRTLRRR